jgi:NADPH:quinone reductase-like Zn-dependent oxidoreductase
MNNDTSTRKRLSGRMKAAVYERYGSPDVLRIAEVPKPIPEKDEVLIQVHAASVNYSDPTFVSGKPFLVRLMGAGLFRPKNPILGADIAGVVEATGSDVAGFRPGDEVFGDLSSCGYGGFAEYACATQDAITLKPPGATYDDAAAVPQAACTALQGLRDAGGIASGHQVLVNGASGGIGTFAVQIARWLGAEVTGVCRTANMEMVSSLGADRVIDYTRENFTAGGPRYDLIFDIVANQSVSKYAAALSPTGTYVACAFNPTSLLMGPLLSRKGGKTVRSLISRPSSADLGLLSGLLDDGDIKPVIDRLYPLTEVAEAIRHYGEGHARGKVVITVADKKE